MTFCETLKSEIINGVKISAVKENNTAGLTHFYILVFTPGSAETEQISTTPANWRRVFGRTLKEYL